MTISILVRPSVRRSGAVSETSRPAPLQLTFDGPRLVIGRGFGCEIRLPDPSVSQRHATVRAEGTGYALQDEGSTNGTFIGGVRLRPQAPRTLRDGDVIRVGRVWLEVRFDQTPATLDLPGATRDLALRLVADAMRAVGDEISPSVRIVEGPDRGRVLTLHDEGRSYLAGRGGDCDLLLDDADGSRHHLEIVRRGTSVVVRDVGSKNGVWLGEAVLPNGSDVAWRGPTMLRAGRNVMALEEPVVRALAELESCPDEALAGPPDSTPSMETGSQAVPTARPSRPEENAPPFLRATKDVPNRSGRGWSGTDVIVVLTAVGIIALSAAGLYWLFRS
jgi:pSer/pThr/pTyr-binding forkhead associated (FHA) protein